MKLVRIGRNTLSEKRGVPWYVKLLKEFTGPLALLLWIAAFLCLIGFFLDMSDFSNLYLAIAIALCVIVIGLFSYFQQSKSAKLMAQFKNFIPPKAVVIRGGQEKEINAQDLVPGDLVRVKEGDNIPADIRIVECYEMKVNNSSLTGESEDLVRKPEKTSDNPFETKNIAFFGTRCTAGTCVACVFETGDRTVIGQIANLATTGRTS